MKTEDGTVVFKSEPYYFKQERDGLKPNTERLLTRAEKLQIKPYVDTVAIEHIKKIRIECTGYPEETHEIHPGGMPKTHFECDPFTRTLTSIEQIGELCGYYLFVFSWRHPSFVDEVIVLKGAINEIVSNPETKRRIYNRASELMECEK